MTGVQTCALPIWKNNTTKENEKADIVRRIFSSYANGKGIRTIMRELNAENIPTFGKGRQNKGAGWSSTHLRRILSSRSVLGEYQPCNYAGRERIPSGEVVANYYPEVVDKATFYKVQEILKKKTHKGGCKRNATNLFTGLVKCAKCGASMNIKQSSSQLGRYHYTSLICSNALRGNGCDYKTIQYSWVERAVLSTLWLKVLPALAQNDTRQDELTKMQGELKNIQAQYKKWMQVIDESQTSPAGAGNKLSALETKEAALKLQIESLSATIHENPLGNWKQVVPTVDNRLRLQTILANEIESLTVDAEKRIATLQLKTTKASFGLAWESSGANGNKKEAGSRRFLYYGEPQAYLDQLLIWKSDQNYNFEGVEIEIMDTEKPIMFGVEVEPNVVGLLEC